MKKLKLNLGDLKVESFEINSNKIVKGTIKGEGPTEPVPLCEYSLDGPPTCWNTCETCGASCPITCNPTCDEISCNGLSCDLTCGCPPDTKFPCN